MTHEELLSAISFFEDAPQEVIDRIGKHVQTVELNRGDVLFREDEEPTDLYVVVSGRVVIARDHHGIDNRESVMALMERGDLFGELALIDGGRRSATARAVEPAVVAKVPYGPVRDELNANPEMLWGVSRMLVSRLRTMDEALADSVFLDVIGRTAKRLLDLSNGQDEFTLPITQEELAGMVGASRERINKSISSFIRLGWIEQHDRQYKILQRAKLEQRAS